MARKETKTLSQKLTAKQELFCQYVAVKKMTQYAAYKKAFGCAKWSRAAVDSKASNLSKIDKIRTRLARLIGKVEEKVIAKEIYTREEWAADAAKILSLALSGEKPDLSVALRAIREKAAAAGIETQKHEISGEPLQIIISQDEARL